MAGIAGLQFLITPFFSFQGIGPDLFVIFLVFYTFHVDWRHISPLAFFVGLVQDLITNSFFGLETASYVLGALVLQFFAIRFDREKRWIQLASLFCVSWFMLIIFSLLSFFIEAHSISGEWILIKTISIALYTTGVGFLVYPVLEKHALSLFGRKQYELFLKP